MLDWREEELRSAGRERADGVHQEDKEPLLWRAVEVIYYLGNERRSGKSYVDCTDVG